MEGLLLLLPYQLLRKIVSIVVVVIRIIIVTTIITTIAITTHNVIIAINHNIRPLLNLTPRFHQCAFTHSQ